MKTRTDFVTNSSSSSFVFVKATGKEFADLVERLREELENLDVTVNIDGKEVSLDAEECYGPAPERLEDVVECLEELAFNEEGVLELSDEEKEEVVNGLKALEWSSGDVRWGESIEPEWFAEDIKENCPKTKEMIIDAVMEEKGLETEDDVTDEMFDQMVEDMSFGSEMVTIHETFILKDGDMVYEKEYEFD